MSFHTSAQPPKTFNTTHAQYVLSPMHHQWEATPNVVQLPRQTHGVLMAPDKAISRTSPSDQPYRRNIHTTLLPSPHVVRMHDCHHSSTFTQGAGEPKILLPWSMAQTIMVLIDVQMVSVQKANHPLSGSLPQINPTEWTYKTNGFT